MIVWSGRGFFPALILIVSFFICFNIFPETHSDYGMSLALLITASLSWYLGNLWNNKQGKSYLDEATGQTLIKKNEHTLFWIPMQHWGAIFASGSIVILFQNSLLFGLIATLLFSGFIVAIFLTKGKIAPKVTETATLTSNNKPYESDPSRKVKKTGNISRKKTMQKTAIEAEELLRLESEKEAERLRRRKEKEDPSRFMPK